LQTTRNMLRSQQGTGQDVIEFAVPHTLAFTFFPQWLTDIRKPFGDLRSRLIAMNVHDAVMLLTEGSCDLLIAYHHPSQPLQLSPERYEMLSLGQETLAPYSALDEEGRPLYRLPTPSQRHRVPYLGYASGAYLGRLVELIARQSSEPLNLDCLYETDMAEGLKAMALEGHGLAFLPASSVKKEIRSKRLVRASAPGVCELSMEVRIYRERPEVARLSKPRAQALWSFLQQR
jgi:DNA-binding transcriptional LysR family regulator